MKARKIWIDCDPGHDDALAILTACAFPEKLEIIGISTVGGNQEIAKVTRNAQNILETAKVNVPLIEGTDKPLVKDAPKPPEVHGDSGMGGVEVYSSTYPVITENGIYEMYRHLEKKEKVTIVGIGPLTNLALLIKTFPKIKEKIQEIIFMGGSLGAGNITPLAEFNFFVDPEAAKIIFQAGIPLVMAGLDVCNKAFITKEEIQQIEKSNAVSQMAYQILQYHQEKREAFGYANSPLYDVCTIAYLLDEMLFTGEKKTLAVMTEEGAARGLTYENNRLKERKPVFVLQNVKREAFIQLLLSGLETFN